MLNHGISYSYWGFFYTFMEIPFFNSSMRACALKWPNPKTCVFICRTYIYNRKTRSISFIWRLIFLVYEEILHSKFSFLLIPILHCYLCKTTRPCRPKLMNKRLIIFIKDLFNWRKRLGLYFNRRAKLIPLFTHRFLQPTLSQRVKRRNYK